MAPKRESLLGQFPTKMHLPVPKVPVPRAEDNAPPEPKLADQEAAALIPPSEMSSQRARRETISLLSTRLAIAGMSASNRGNCRRSGVCPARTRDTYGTHSTKMTTSIRQLCRSCAPASLHGQKARNIKGPDVPSQSQHSFPRRRFCDPWHEPCDESSIKRLLLTSLTRR